jgi:RNA polymerase sigma-70 factor, ECF subfamily
MEKVRRRDPQALGAFFDRYFDLIHGLVYRLVGRPEHVEDVCQDVFLRVHGGLTRFDTTRDPAPWLATIVGNACREHWRGKHVRARQRSVSISEIGDWEARHPRSGSNPEADLLRDERDRRVRQAILDLPEPLREVVLLHDFQELSHREIAEVLGASHDSIRKRHSRAIARLGKTLKDEGA